MVHSRKELGNRIIAVKKILGETVVSPATVVFDCIRGTEKDKK